MGVCLAILALACGQAKTFAEAVPFGPEVIRPPSKMFRQLVPNPTGRNGYEEMVQALELVDGTVNIEWLRPALAGGAATFSEQELRDPGPAGQLRRQLAKMSYLELCRELRKRYGPALALVSASRSKRWWFPRELNFSTLFPEFSGLRRLMRLAIAASYADAAEGNSGKGTRTVVDAFSLAQEMGGILLIGYFVGSSIQANYAEWLANNLGRLSQQELRLVEASLLALETSPSREAVVLQAETNGLKMVRGALKDDQELTGMVFTPQGAEAYLRLPASAQKRVFDLFDRKVESEGRRLQAILLQPESKWPAESGPSATPSVSNDPQGLAETMWQMMEPDSVSTFRAFARTRTIRRLMLLHVKVQQYRWAHGVLPTTLADAAKGMTFDPLSNKPFVYVQRGSSYELYSEGGLGMSKIDLRYRPSLDTEQGPVEP